MSDKEVNHANFNPGFPVYIYEEGLDLPQEGTYFVVAGNGCWLHKDMPLVRCFVPVDKISVLQEIDDRTMISCKLPKIPQVIVYRVKQFFAEVVRRYHTEANVILYYNKEKNLYQAVPSKQSVSMGGVHYKRKGVTEMPGMEGFLRVGTIHSHCDFGAFHSGTDIGDERDFDGLHCTFGHNDKDTFTISASIVVNAHRASVDPMKVMEGITPSDGEMRLADKHHAHDKWFSLAEPANPEDKVNWMNHIESWMSTVEKPTPVVSLWGRKSEFSMGDKVVWADGLNLEKWRGMFGEGPFEIERPEGDKVVVRTVAGLARFSSKVFKKVKDEEKKEAPTLPPPIQATAPAETKEDKKIEQAQEG
jgi:hypothetical protein